MGDAQDARRAVAITVGIEHACALLDSGEVECWGANQAGQADPPSGRFNAVSAAGWHTCGLRESGEIECWGYTFDGQAQPPAGAYRAISAGARHTCALTEDGAAICWMVYNGTADVPAWLRQPPLAAPATGSGGMLGRSAEAPNAGLAALGAALLSLLTLALLRRSRRRP